LVSDVYFGEGSYEVLMDDPVGGPVLTAGGELLVRLVDSVVETQGVIWKASCVGSSVSGV
jgi:hypothetical protein